MTLVFDIDLASRMTLMSLNEGNFDESLFIEQQLKAYDAESKTVNDLILEQEKLLDAIHVCHG
jgi:hypothetical protein